MDRRGGRAGRALARVDDDKAAWDDVVLGAIADPHGYVDAGAHELAALPRDEVLARWAAGRDGAARRR